MKLLFYSGMVGEESSLLDEELLRMAEDRDFSLVYIPSLPSDYRYEYEYIADVFRGYGFNDFHCLDLQAVPIRTATKILDNAGVVFIGGGNTYYLLDQLRHSGLGTELIKFAHSGGVIAGHSAGAIVLTPNIKTAGFPSFDCDENTVGLKQLTALRLVPFEFFPHFPNLPRYSRELRRYSESKRSLLIAARDGGGVAIDQGRMVFIGDVWGFWRGERLKLHPNPGYSVSERRL